MSSNTDTVSNEPATGHAIRKYSETARPRRWLWIVVAVVGLAALLRGWAILQLPVDFDEPTYLQAGADYARLVAAGKPLGIVDYEGNREHPALVKLLYGLELLVLGSNAGATLGLLAARALSALFGTLAVLLLALLDPLGGGLLAAHTLTIKYTGQAYLEALPHLASLGAVLAFVRSARARDGWFWLSAVALGVAAASKFTYLPVVVVIAYLAIWDKRRRGPDLLLYILLAVATFLLLNPTLWRDPLGRLVDMLFFHVGYSQGARVEAAGYPWYQPLVWLSRSMPSEWHARVFFYPAVDALVLLLALPGLVWEWIDRRWVVVWIVAGLAFLLLWPTKWPQYTLLVIPPLCLAASSTLRHAYRWIQGNETYWRLLTEMFPRPSRSFLIAFGGLVLVVAAIYTVASVQQTVGRLAWTSFSIDGTLLPSNTVYDLLPLPGGDMVMATERGAVIWSPPPATDLPDRWQIFTTANSGLPDNRVLALARDPAGRLYFGTAAGLAVRSADGSDWQVYQAADLGLTEDKINDLAVTADGRLWVATPAGAAVRSTDGQTWTAMTARSSEGIASGLAFDQVRVLAVVPGPAGDRIWFGGDGGLSLLDTEGGQPLWISFQPEALGGKVVSSLLVDSTGRLWAGTLGGGLALWDGSAWQSYRTGNSDLPFSEVMALAEVEPGIFWIGTALPNEAGGTLSEFDGQAWRHYNRRSSGYSGAEPLVITTDERGWRWIGTRTQGINIYRGSSGRSTARP